MAVLTNAKISPNEYELFVDVIYLSTINETATL